MNLQKDGLTDSHVRQKERLTNGQTDKQNNRQIARLENQVANLIVTSVLQRASVYSLDLGTVHGMFWVSNTVKPHYATTL